MKNLFQRLLLLAGIMLCHEAVLGIEGTIGPLDELINDPNTVIIVGKVKSIEKQHTVDCYVDFTIHIVRTLKGPPQGVPDPLPVLTSWCLHWDLPLKPGLQVLFFLKKLDNGKYNIQQHVWAVLPIVATKLPEKVTPDNLFGVIRDNLILSVERENHPYSKALLLRLAADICPAKDADLFLPFLKSENIWIRRVALGALLKLTNRKEYLEAVQEDLIRFFKALPDTLSLEYGSTDNKNVILDIYSDIYEAASLDDLTGRKKQYLPLYRIVLDHHAPHDHLTEFALIGMYGFATKEDLMRIYRFHDSKDEDIRFRSLQCIAEALKLDWNADDSEAAKQKLVRATLIKEGLLKNTMGMRSNRP